METFAQRLIEWYEEQKRDLPWRNAPTAYGVWVSEVMLQQTTVPAVVGRFSRWMERFPDIPSLAAASERDVLSEWEGLGYYQRASRMREAARTIVEHHNGRLPSDETALRRLPGIGSYIASAIRSLAFGEDEVALDANVGRVFMRLLAIKTPAGNGRTRREIHEAASRILPADDSSRFNQALMDFGSLICRPANPECDRCFATQICRAFQEGRQHEIPPARRKKWEKIETSVAVFIDGAKVYIQQRPRDGLFGGMWEFPGGKVEPGETAVDAVVREVREELAAECTVTDKVTSFVHFYTRFRVTLHAFLCSTEANLPRDEKHQWVGWEEIGDYPMPTANRKLIGHIRTFRQRGKPRQQPQETR